MAASHDPSTVHRLSDMETEEVSLVDRAANKRKFLIVKAEGVPMPQEVTARPDGTFTAGAPAPAAPPAAAVAPTATTKAGAKLTADAQSALSDLVGMVIDAMTKAQEEIASAEVVETEAEMSADSICEMLSTCAEQCEDACAALVGLDEMEQDEPLEGEPPTDAQVAEPKAANQPGPPLTMSMGKRLDVRLAKRTIAKAHGTHEGRTLLMKYGAKMRKDRFDRFQSALGVLSSIIGEVSPAMSADLLKAKKKPMPPGAPEAGAPEETGKAVKPAAVPAPPPGGPQAPNTPPGALAPPGKKKPGAPEPAAKSDHEIALEGTITKLAKQLETLQAPPGRSNAIPVEKSAPAQRDGFSWPMDMNFAPDDDSSGNRFG
jgi:hypothetical protein